MPHNSYSSLETHKPDEGVSEKKVFRKLFPLALLVLALFFVVAYFVPPIFSSILNQSSSTSETPFIEKERTPQELKYDSVLKDFPYTGTSGVKSFSSTTQSSAIVITGQLVDVANDHLLVFYPSSNTNIEIAYGDALTIKKSAASALTPDINLEDTQSVLLTFVGSFVEVQANVTLDGFLEANSFDFASFRDVSLDNLTTEY